MPLVSSDVCNDPTLSEPDRAAIGEGLNIKAIISTPLRRREGNIIWSLTVGTEVSREWSSEDLRLVQDVAERAWGAIERARTESALRVSEERYQTLFEASPVPFMVLAPNPPDFTILAANEAYYEATLRTPETLLGRRLFDVFSDDPSRPGLLGSEALAISLDKVLNERRTDVMKRVRYDIVNPRGEFEPHWWEAINAPMLDATGRVSAIIHQVHRVTELERAEQAEREAQERQAFLLKLTDALRPLADPMVIKETAARVLGEHLRARRVFYAEIEGGDWLIDRGYEEALAPVAEGRFPIDVFGGWVVDIFRKGQRLVARDLDADSRFDPSERSAYDSYHAHAIVAVPLIKKGELVALLAVHNATPREWTDLEVALVEETAERTWAAVERARAEAALTVSEANFRSMAHVVPDLLWYGEPDGSIIWFNERWMEYTGQRFEDAIGKGWMNVIHPEDREESARRYRESVELGRPREREHRMRRLDGEYRWFLVRTQPLLDESGRVVRMYGAATDVHAAHVARDALEARVAERTSELAAALEDARSNEERLRLLLQQVPAMLWATDRELHVTRLMGADVPIAGGQKGGGTVDDLFADVDSAGMLALHRRVLAGTPAQFEFHIDRRTYEAHLEPLLDVDGETVGTIGVAHDATDRTLRRLQEDFIASVSHELQTPLTSIRAGLGLLDASIGATLGPAERELLGASRRNAERLRLEIGQLLAANQLTMSGPKVERSPIDLHELVDEAVRSLQSLLQEKDQIVNVDMPDRLEVEGDRRLLEQVLANLLSNAHRHTPPGTSIAVSGWFVGNDVRLAVHDTGPGIAPDQLEVIFQRFYRAPDSRREGIGLGLAITRDAVEAQGGRVWVESVLGQGTTFFVSLPRAGDTQSA
jgi:PAS domain S-box-containing protein